MPAKAEMKDHVYKIHQGRQSGSGRGSFRSQLAASGTMLVEKRPAQDGASSTSSLRHTVEMPTWLA
jgi:hypothetical protein